MSTGPCCVGPCRTECLLRFVSIRSRRAYSFLSATPPFSNFFRAAALCSGFFSCPGQGARFCDSRDRLAPPASATYPGISRAANLSWTPLDRRAGDDLFESSAAPCRRPSSARRGTVRRWTPTDCPNFRRSEAGRFRQVPLRMVSRSGTLLPSTGLFWPPCVPGTFRRNCGRGGPDEDIRSPVQRLVSLSRSLCPPGEKGVPNPWVASTFETRLAAYPLVHRNTGPQSSCQPVGMGATMEMPAQRFS